MDELLTSDDVIAELRISRSTLDRLLASGQLKALKIGNGALRFRRADVLAVLQPRPSRQELSTRGAGRGFLKLT